MADGLAIIVCSLSFQVTEQCICVWKDKGGQ